MRLIEATFQNAASYGPERISLAPLGPVNALVGKNNAGKSNIFRLLNLAVTWPQSGQGVEVKGLPLHEAAWHMGWGGDPMRISLRAQFTGAELAVLKNVAVTDPPGEFIHTVEFHAYSSDDGRRVCDVRVVGENGTLVDDNTHVAAVQCLRAGIIYLPTERHVTPEHVSSGGLGNISVYDGSQLKKWLNSVLSPRTQHTRWIRDSFLSDIRSIEGFQNLSFSVAVDDNSQLNVLVSDGESGYPTSLDDCGAGLQMVAIVLAAQHALPGAIVLIDDVENNLHPRAQEQFCRILGTRATASNGQVLFTTHSPAMLDHVPDEAIFEVTRVSGRSKIARLDEGTRPLLDVLRDLGNRPGLLRMADALVFVEGPSDEAVLRVWWQKLFNDPPEPAVVFLQIGGTNMKHLTPTTVRGLGRQAFALVDSDRTGPEVEPKSLAVDLRERLKDAAEVHILERRTIESYFSGRAIAEIFDLDSVPEESPYATLRDFGVEYSKGAHAASIAARMTEEEIPAEIVTFLARIAEASGASPSETAE